MKLSSNTKKYEINTTTKVLKSRGPKCYILFSLGEGERGHHSTAQHGTAGSGLFWSAQR